MIRQTPITPTRPIRRSDAARLHEQILAAAVPFVKLHGIDAPVDEIMRAAGLTSGALYSHFKNKQDLCEQVICRALDEIVARYRRIFDKHGRAGLKIIVDQYLGDGHIGAIATGCPFVALGADMARGSTRARRLYELRFQALIDMFAAAFGKGAEARRKAQQLTATLVGTVTFARSMGDAASAAALLRAVRTSLLQQLDG